MLILFILYLFGLKKDYQLYALLLILLLSINNPFRHLTFIDVGQGDAILLSNYNYKVLIDTGSSYNYHKLKKTLFNQGVYTIDYLLISHNDDDHCGNVDNLKKDFKIKNIVFDKKDIEYKDLYLNCLDAGSFDNENDNSLVYYLNVDGFSFLFTGDISKNVERMLLNKYDLNKIDCLKVGHHGSNTSTSPFFIANLLPDYAIISTNGKYNHPHVDTITTLRKYLVNILSTKEEGDISFYLLGFIKFITCKSKIIYLY